MRLPRVLTQNRGFSACVILSLGVGISAAAGVFALVESMRYGRLPFPNADRIEHLYASSKLDPGSQRIYLPPEVARALEVPGSPVEALALYRWSGMHVKDGERELGASGLYVTSNFQSVFGARMTLGRPLDPSLGETPSVVLSFWFWTSRFGSDSSVVGRAVDINGTSHSIVGVAAPEWELSGRMGLWASPIPRPTGAARPERVGIFALMRVGTNPEQGRATIATIVASTTMNSENSLREGERIVSMPLRDYLKRGLLPAIIVLTIIAVLLAFITAVNFAGLLLARGIRRRGEIGVRAALGASVLRLARHIVGETLVLCALGGVLAAILAPLVVDVLRNSVAYALPGWLDIVLGWRTMVSSILTGLVLGAVFGLGPALDLARPALTAFLRTAGSTATAGSGAVRTRAILVGVQVALATGVLVSLGAMLGRALTLTRPDVGFDPAPLIEGWVRTDSGSNPDFRAVAANVQAVPGIAGVAVVHSRYLDRKAMTDDEGAPPRGLPTTWFAEVSDSFFTVLRPRLVAGRFPGDDEWRSAAPVAVISRLTARRMFDDDAIGQAIRVDQTRYTVIGVVDKLEPGMVLEPGASVFVPAGNVRPKSASTHFYVRVVDRAQLAQPLGQLQLRAADRQLGVPVYEVRSVDAMLRQQTQSFRAVTRIVFGIFGIALGLAALGIYGLVAYTAEARSREMAIREALGATRLRVAGLVMRTAVLQTLGGVAGGVLLAWLAALYVRRYNFQPNVAIETTALALALISMTLLLSSIGPLRAIWRRDLSYVLRV